MSLRLEKLEIARAGAVMVRIDREIGPGEVLSVMGPSGCGKSTLLAALVGALPEAFALRGRVWLEGRDMTRLLPHQRRMGILFQDDLLFPHLSVAGNLGFGLARGVADRAGVIDRALREAGLEAMGARDPATLSGGQRARVALMRVLLSEPRALLLDEPFSKLDAGLRAQMREFVFARARARGLPVVLVTHDRADARAAGGAVVSVTGDAVAL